MGDFCDAIRLGTTPRSSAELGIEVVRIIEAVDRSLEAEGARIELERPVSDSPRHPAMPVA